MSSLFVSNEAAIFALGSKNAAKRNALELALKGPFPAAQIECVTVPSGVSDQPMSDAECIEGATQRALNALEAVPSAHYGVGMEGGVHQIGKRWFECGWIAVIHRESGEVGLGSSARFELSNGIISRLQKGEELAEVMDDLTGLTDVRSSAGAMGILTGGHLNRPDAYSHGITFALAKFCSEEKYWPQ